MIQTLSTEEILNRMKVHVDQCQTVSRPSASSNGWAGNGQLNVSSPSGEIEPGPRASRDLLPLQFEINTALEGTRQVGQLTPRQPGLHTDAIQFAKKVMRRSLSWYTRPIHYFQGAVIRALQQILILLQGHEDSIHSLFDEVDRHASLLAHAREESATASAGLGEEIAMLKQRAAALREEIADLHVRLKESQDSADNAMATLEKNLNDALRPYSERIAEITDRMERLSSESDQLRTELRDSALRARLRDRDWRRYFHDIQAGTSPSESQAAVRAIPPMFPAGIKSDSEFDYFGFEELYRGDEASIASRQRDYVDLFRGRNNVLDAGCGRGEFLELLRLNGIQAKGVELGTDQYLLCREKKLDVVQEDLFTFLESIPDGSLGGLFSAQVIEHFSASDQLRFVALAYQKTAPDSPVIIETINVQSIFALTRNFFLDPTHVRPVHPLTLKFAMQSANFHDVELRFSSPMSDRRIPPLLNGDSSQTADFNRAMEELNELIYGYLDYAAIGWR